MSKEVKTNAMRFLDTKKIPYSFKNYDVGEFTDGVTASEISGTPLELSYKTLVTSGKSGGYFVFVIPVEAELDMKKAAKAAGEKSVEMIPVKDITKVTGYVRGGCSPIGMKKLYKTVIDISAEDLEEFYVSGGRIGTSIKVSPKLLAGSINAVFAKITA